VGDFQKSQNSDGRRVGDVETEQQPPPPFGTEQQGGGSSGTSDLGNDSATAVIQKSRRRPLISFGTAAGGGGRGRGKRDYEDNMSINAAVSPDDSMEEGGAGEADLGSRVLNSDLVCEGALVTTTAPAADDDNRSRPEKEAETNLFPRPKNEEKKPEEKGEKEEKTRKSLLYKSHGMLLYKHKLIMLDVNLQNAFANYSDTSCAGNCLKEALETNHGRCFRLTKAVGDHNKEEERHRRSRDESTIVNRKGESGVGGTVILLKVLSKNVKLGRPVRADEV